MAAQEKIVSLNGMTELSRTPEERPTVTIRPARADEWSRWRETRLRMLRDDADFFSTRYDDMVREPDKMWRDWVGEAAVGDQKAIFVADENDQWLGVVGAFTRVNPLEVQLISMWVDPVGTRTRHRAGPHPRGCGMGARSRLDHRRALRPGGERAGSATLRARRLHGRPATARPPLRAAAPSSSCSRLPWRIFFALT